MYVLTRKENGKTTVVSRSKNKTYINKRLVEEFLKERHKTPELKSCLAHGEFATVGDLWFNIEER